MRWLLVTLDFPPAYVGGIASWTADLAMALHTAGHDVRVLAKRTGDTRATDTALPYPVLRMPGRSWQRWQGTWAALSVAREVARLGARDLCVVVATWRLAWPLVRAPWPPGTRLAVATHGSDLTRLVAPPPVFGEALRCVDAILPLSAFLARELDRLGVADRRVRVLPVPLAIPPMPAPRPRAGLVCVCRPTPLKGLDRAARLARALDRRLTVVGVAAGQSPRLDGVELLGELPRDRVLSLLGDFEAALLLPRADADGLGAEGLGLALLEAAARGTPAVGSRTGGVPEAVGPGVVLEHPDEPERELGHVRALLADPTAGERAHAWVAREHGARRTLEVLLEALA